MQPIINYTRAEGWLIDLIETATDVVSVIFWVGSLGRDRPLSDDFRRDFNVTECHTSKEFGAKLVRETKQGMRELSEALYQDIRFPGSNIYQNYLRSINPDTFHNQLT